MFYKGFRVIGDWNTTKDTVWKPVGRTHIIVWDHNDKLSNSGAIYLDSGDSKVEKTFLFLYSPHIGSLETWG